jgi:hypothetical protein
MHVRAYRLLSAILSRNSDYTQRHKYLGLCSE